MVRAAPELPRRQRIFISYSRKDLDFVERLDAALRARQIEPLIDRSDIQAFEPWWARIEALIVQADTIVFVLSPNSTGSDIALREVAFAASLNKRFAPVVARAVDPAQVPDALARLNFVVFSEASEFDASVDRLVDALNTDISWVRKHTELGEIALRWSAAGRPGSRGLLLRSPLLEEAESWIASRPEGAPVPTEATQALIVWSRSAATRRRNMLAASLGAGLMIAMGLSLVAWWQRGIAVENEAIAREQRDRALVTQARFLADRANQHTQSGDAGSALLLAREALPDARQEPTKPYVRQAEVALYYAWQAHREMRLFAGHAQSVRSASYSPDARRIASVFNDNTLQVWDAETGVAALKVDAQALGTTVLSRVAYSHDGRRLAVSTAPELLTRASDKIAIILDAETGAPQVILRGHDGHVMTAAFSFDGRYVVTGSTDEDARVWDATTGQLVHVLVGHTSYVNHASFSPDGTRILTASSDLTARIWDATTGLEIRRFKAEDAINPMTAAFSPDGSLVATGGNDSRARIWDARSGKLIHTLVGHASMVGVVSFSMDGREVVTGSFDGTVRAWDVGSGAQIARLAAHQGWVTAAQPGPAGDRILTVSEGTVRIWGRKGPNETIEIRLPKILVRRAAFSPDGRHLLTASGGVLSLWETATGGQLASAATSNGELWAPSLVFYSRDGQQIVSVHGDSTVRTWDTMLAGETSSFKLPPGRVLHYDPAARRALIVQRDHSVELWDNPSGARLATYRGHTATVTDAAISPDGRRVVTGSQEKARIWDAESGQLLHIIPREWVSSVAFSPDGRRVATGGPNPTIWDSGTGRELTVLDGATAADSVSFSPDGGRLLTTGGDRTGRIWDARTGELVLILAGHREGVSIGAFSADGKLAATMSSDRTARIWRIPRSREELIETTQSRATRCLTRAQRVAAFLDPEPPLWCIEKEKWPYHSQDWKDWLRFRKASAKPPLPDTPEWKSWIEARRAVTHSPR